VSDLFAVLARQRACRAFEDRPVPDELVTRVLEAATRAPSAENRQPWVFVVVTDPGQRRAVCELGRQAWEGGARRWSESRLTPALLADVDRGVRGGMAGAPRLIVVCGDARLGHPGALAASIFPAVQNLLLAATASGLGSALTTLPLAGGEGLRALLALPEGVEPMAVVPLGWPARPLGPSRRLPVGDKTYRDRFGTAW
jgi:nitroreductase